MASASSPVCVNNRTTLGALRAITAKGLQMPVAGFDDLEMADILGLRLILVGYEPEEVGREAARLLLDRMGASEEISPAASSSPPGSSSMAGDQEGPTCLSTHNMGPSIKRDTCD